MFLKSIDQDERMKLGILLEDDDDTNAPAKNWYEVRRKFQQYDKQKRNTSLKQSRINRSFPSPIHREEKSSSKKIVSSFDMDELIRKA